MTMQFRLATRDDFEGIWNVLMDGKAVLGKLGIDQWQGSYPSRDVVLSDIDAGYSYVVEEDGVIIATEAITFNGEKVYDCIDGVWLTDSTSAAPRYAVLHRVASLSTQSGRGLGRMLLASGLQVARERGSESVRIETHPANGPMLKLIERSGFTRCGIITIDHAEGGIPERVAFEVVL